MPARTHRDQHAASRHAVVLKGRWLGREALHHLIPARIGIGGGQGRSIAVEDSAAGTENMSGGLSPSQLRMIT